MDFSNKMITPLCCLNTAVNQYINAIYEMVYAISIQKSETADVSAFADSIKNGVIPQLQAILEIERLLLRKFIYLLEYFPIDGKDTVYEADTLNRKTKIVQLNRVLHQLCPNDSVIEDTIEAIFQLDAQKKKVIESFFQCRQKNDPKTVWLSV
ncbi:hypothetical protein [Neobacillus kokaensis]|uniref:Uncharacterized protein n=1 Tax=Neobacillus kokaensis TaxID=2759023 RepID=A0ABQ3MYB6_9BACI|nr:hypothetical protein [Neobacillus kokaensis]GHH96901.1 hypothetical protein AM1BK_04440 [Neobacillus kokaensis]